MKLTIPAQKKGICRDARLLIAGGSLDLCSKTSMLYCQEYLEIAGTGTETRSK